MQPSMDRTANATYEFSYEFERPLTVAITTENKDGSIQWSVDMEACKHVLLGRQQKHVGFRLRFVQGNWKCVAVGSDVD